MFLQPRYKLSAVVLAFALTLSSAMFPWLSAYAEDGPRECTEDCGKVVLQFSTVGDSRQDPTKPDPTTTPLSGQDKTWLQNTKAWSRIMRSIEREHSELLFFNGDMIMGYGNAGVPPITTTVKDVVGSDLMKFYRQYGFWRGMVATMLEKGTYVVPVPGNHETQCNSSVSNQCPKSGKKAVENNENAWRDNMGDLILDDQRFLKMFGDKPSNEDVSDTGVYDSLSTNQQQLSFSFDFRGAHFVVINTDPVGKDAHAPVKWLQQDLQAAKGRGARNVFVFGHKPAFTYYFNKQGNPSLPDTPSGLDNDAAARDEFWALIEQYKAVYFCGHEHIFHMSQPTKEKGGDSWQVLVGSGGSPFEAPYGTQTVNPQTDRDYAWATVKVYENGTVKITAYGFDDQYGATHVLGSIKLKQ